MQLKSINKAFVVTTSISVLLFVYLVFIGYDEIRTLKDVIKIVASILFPLPMLFFARFILIEHFLPENSDEYKMQNQKPATMLLLVTMVVALLTMQGVEWLTQSKLENHLIFAHLINSTTIGSYVLNFIIYNNLKFNGILSGVLLSLAIHVFFLSV